MKEKEVKTKNSFQGKFRVSLVIFFSFGDVMYIIDSDGSM